MSKNVLLVKVLRGIELNGRQDDSLKTIQDMFWRDHPDSQIKVAVLDPNGKELQSLTTDEVENNDHPIFNEILSFEGYSTQANYRSKIEAYDVNAVMKNELFGTGEFAFPDPGALQQFTGRRRSFKINWQPIDPVELKTTNSDGGQSSNGIVSLKTALCSVRNNEINEFRMLISELNHVGQKKAAKINEENSSGECCCVVL